MLIKEIIKVNSKILSKTETKAQHIYLKISNIY